jgi:MoaA/NifB/PqqE/SkfB family radical SAM enzyme
MRIDPRGRCYTSIKLKDQIGEEALVGNVMQTSMMEIWQSAPLFQIMREMPSELSHFGNVVDVREVVRKLKETRKHAQS